MEFGTSDSMDRGGIAVMIAKARLELEIARKERSAKIAGNKDGEKRVETIGRRLHDAQKNLANIQQTGADRTERVELKRSDVQKRQEVTAKSEKLYNADVENIQGKSDRTEQSQRELDALNQMVLTVERYADEVESEVLVGKRAAHKSEDALRELELQTKRRDFRLADIKQENMRKKEEITATAKNIEYQKKQISQFDEMLAEVNINRENLNFEKKQVMIQWKSSLNDLSKRNDALDAIKKVTEEQSEKGKALESELEGTKMDIRKSQEENERLNETLDKLETDARRVDEQSVQLEETLEVLMERHSLFKKSADTTEKNIGVLESQVESLRELVSQGQTGRQHIDRQRREIEQQILVEQSQKVTANKAATNLMKETTATRDNIHKKELEIATLENERARIVVDSLNTEAHNEALRQSSNNIKREIELKATESKAREVEIDQNNTTIEKAILFVERLNRKLEKLTSGDAEENLGPMEAQIHNLKKLKKQSVQECEDLKRRWLKTQSEWVKQSDNTENVKQKIRNLEAEGSVLDAKIRRQELHITQQERMLNEIKNEENNLQRSFARINADTSRQNEEGQRAASEYNNMQDVFTEELKSKQRDVVEKELIIKEQETKNEEIVSEVIELEKEVHALEKNIKLEKEMQEAMDPSIGQAELAEMNKEIHRMELRLTALKAEKRKLDTAQTHVMDRMLRKIVKVRTNGGGNGKGNHSANKEKSLTNAQLQAQIKNAMKEIDITENKLEKTKTERDEALLALESMAGEIEKIRQDQEQERIISQELMDDLKKTMYAKQVYVDTTQKYKNTITRYNDLAKGEMEHIGQYQIEEVANALEHYEKMRQRIVDVTTKLAEKHPDQRDVLETIAKMSNV
eukprot:TRINITY_DN774120_c0_g1_i1.p1 TRINITY_DN774120_c0_g1~~TRINITY_DN774120_c0_g1_i1.p1  ORF type:complete len:867 (-),score=347.93 TRINITY_DN774120_c0_g1_i1:177-2777(-)